MIRNRGGKEVVEIYTDRIKEEVAARFRTRMDDLKLLGDSENFVYSYPLDVGFPTAGTRTHSPLALGIGK